MFFVDGPRTETANLAHCEIVVYYTDTFVCLGFFANQDKKIAVASAATVPG